jgi:G3E family GTPase
MMQDVAPIPLTLLTGFLGAGKTTLLNRLLREPEAADTAVIINEYGEVPIDHMLVEAATPELLALPEGCLCCTVRGELVDTLLQLVERQRHGEVARLQRIILETSGLADPVPVVQALIQHPLLSAAFRLDGVVAVADALEGGEALDRHEEAVKQVAIADRLVLTKTDLTGPGAVATFRERLHALNRRAAVIEGAAESRLAPLLFGLSLHDARHSPSAVKRWLEGEPAKHHSHDDHCNPGGPVDHHHDHRVRTLSLRHPGAMPFAALDMFLDLLRSLHGDRLLRLKGIIELAEEPERPLVVHGVGRTLYPPARLDAWPEDSRGTRLVVIGLDLPEDYVSRLFAAATGEPKVDQPDRTALTDNPLAIPGMPGRP